MTLENLKKKKECKKLKQHYDSERRLGSKMAKELKDCKSKLKELRSRVFNLETQVCGLKTKLSASKALVGKLLCRGKVAWRNRFRIRASIWQLHYRLLQCRVPSNQHHKIIRCVAHAFNVPLPRLCDRRTIQRFRTESGLRSFKCVARAASCAKKIAGPTFYMSKTRDGTHKNYRIPSQWMPFQNKNGVLKFSLTLFNSKQCSEFQE